MVTWTQLVMVVGVTILFLGFGVITQAESNKSIERDSNLLDDVASNDALTDEVGESPQSNDTMIFRYAFTGGDTNIE